MSGRSCSRATRVFFERDADPAKEAAHHRGVGFDAALGQKPVAKRGKRDVRFLGPRCLQKITVRHQLGRPVAAVPDRLSRAIPFHPLEPFDRYGFTDLVVASRRAAAQASLHRVNHPVAQVLRIRLGHSCWPPPSQQVESKYPRFGNPTPRFKPKTARSKIPSEGALTTTQRGTQRAHRCDRPRLQERGTP